jgi:hypothetical protein
MSDKVSMKLSVIYLRPKDVQAFETVYNRDHRGPPAPGSRAIWGP